MPGSMSGRGTSGSRKERFTCTGPGCSPVAAATARAIVETAVRSSVAVAASAVGGGEVGVQAHEGAEHPRLPCGLVRADVPQLGRTVRGEHDQRDPRVVGLHHRGVQMRGRRAGGRDHHRRMLGVEPGQAQRGEGGGALVDPHVGTDRSRELRAGEPRRPSGALRDPGASTASVTPSSASALQIAIA